MKFERFPFASERNPNLKSKLRCFSYLVQGMLVQARVSLNTRGREREREDDDVIVSSCRLARERKNEEGKYVHTKQNLNR